MRGWKAARIEWQLRKGGGGSGGSGKGGGGGGGSSGGPEPIDSKLPHNELVSALEAVGRAEFNKVAELQFNNPDAYDALEAAAQSAPIRLIAAASDIEKRHFNFDTVTENMDYYQWSLQTQGKLTGGRAQSELHAEAARAMLSYASRSQLREVATLYKGSPPSSINPIARDIMRSLGATYDGDKWQIPK